MRVPPESVCRTGSRKSGRAPSFVLLTLRFSKLETDSGCLQNAPEKSLHAFGDQFNPIVEWVRYVDAVILGEFMVEDFEACRTQPLNQIWQIVYQQRGMRLSGRTEIRFDSEMNFHR